MTDPYDYFKKTPAHIRMVNTSVQDCRVSLNFVTDPDLVRRALAYEKANGQRSSMIKLLAAKLKTLEKSMGGAHVD
ncbi:hypothetical protein [Desulfotignum balticum]|uniref:hypothetical protein n=1 Tax=Desulfotignum balticum TaxID=115781 RepID=UPI0003F79D9F|nr:hypothetical protein [Desulfotignum balticum]